MTATLREEIAKAVCAETCAFKGEPPCHSFDGLKFPPDTCDEPGCEAIAMAVAPIIARIADPARVMCKTMRAGLASRELTLEGSKDMCDFIAKALDDVERAVGKFDDFNRGHSGKSPNGDNGGSNV
ncbi:MAG: hypothetical protein INF12_14505 [Methylobacterium sp.]|nr:hypothetical protein [Methylobacterium sp.]